MKGKVEKRKRLKYEGTKIRERSEERMEDRRERYKGNWRMGLRRDDGKGVY